MDITQAQLSTIMPQASPNTLLRYLPHLNAAMAEWGIDTPQRQAAFLAQLAHESGQLRYVSELADGYAYNDRADLGNTSIDAILAAADHGAEPGPWWKGHGLIQITGYANHVECGQALGLDLVNSPLLLCEPVHAARSAAWFWHRWDLNRWADVGDFDGVSDMINRGRKTAKVGDANGYADRIAAYRRAQTALA